MMAQQTPTIKSYPRENGLSHENREKIGKTVKVKEKIEAEKERIEKIERTGKAKNPERTPDQKRTECENSDNRN